MKGFKKMAGTGATSLLMVAGLAAVSTPPADRVVTAASENACVDEALALKAPGWVCLGDSLSWNAGTDRRPVWKQKRIPAANQVAVTLVNDDTWREYAGKCSRIVTDYQLETKGNATFGDETGALGGFDVIWRSFHRGAKVRWRLHLHHDWGQAVNTDEWSAWEVEENWGPDGWHCFADFGANMPTIWDADGHRNAWDPAPDRERACSEAKDKKETWHDDLKGRFFSGGQASAASMLHTGHWRSWVDSDGDTRSQVTSSWDY